MEIPRIVAKRELRLRGVEMSLDEDKVYNLILSATEDEDKADKARADYIMAKIKSGQNVD